MKHPPRSVMVHALVVTLILGVTLGSVAITLFGTVIVVGLSCIFGYFILYKSMDRFYGWYLSETAKENASLAGAGGAGATVDIPTCPNCNEHLQEPFPEPTKRRMVALRLSDMSN